MSAQRRLETLEKLERPLRSEAAMFRVVVAIGLAALPVIAAGLILGSLAATIVLLVEVGVSIGVGLRRRAAGRQETQHEAPPPPTP